MDEYKERLAMQFGSFPEPVVFLGAGRLLYANEPGERLLREEEVEEDLLFALAEHPGETTELALGAGARVVGVNNRDHKTFKVDMNVSLRLRPLVPREIVFVSESGVNGPEDIEKLRRCGADAVLVGERLMRASDKRAALAELRGTAR